MPVKTIDDAELARKVFLMRESGHGHRYICRQLKVGHHRLAHIEGTPEWRLFEACEECGVDAAKCCRDDDNRPARKACKGRVQRKRWGMT